MTKIIVYVTAIIAFTPNFITASLHRENPKIAYLKRTDEERKKAQRGILLLPSHDPFFIDWLISNYYHVWGEGSAIRRLFSQHFMERRNINLMPEHLLFFRHENADCYLIIATTQLDETYRPYPEIGQPMPPEWGYRLGFNNDIFTRVDIRNEQNAPQKTFLERVRQFISPANLPNPTDIFKTNSEYSRNNRIKDIPEWTIFMIAHGIAGKLQCERPLPQFKQILDFFEKKVTTRLFAYNSCFSGGINEQKLYSTPPAEYSYSILIPVGGDHSAFTTFDFSSINIFFQEAFKLEWDLNKMATALGLDYPKHSSRIRLPGMTWFSPLDIAKHSAVIGDIRAATCSAEKPIKISEIIKEKTEKINPKHPIYILLQSANIPCPIELLPNSQQYTYNVISMIPGPTAHYISSIIIPGSSFEEADITSFFERFSPHGSIRAPKRFLIDRIVFSQGANTKVIRNVLIIPGNFYYKYQEQTYTKKQTHNASEEHSELWQQYYQEISQGRRGKSEDLRTAAAKISQVVKAKISHTPHHVVKRNSPIVGGAYYVSSGPPNPRAMPFPEQEKK